MRRRPRCAVNTGPAPRPAGAVPGYLEELGNPNSRTETFVAIKAEIGNWRWAGVPFYLRTGKRLPARMSEIIVTFRSVPHSVFEDEPPTPNRLVIRLQPDEGIKLWLMIKDPGPGGMRLQHVSLDMSFAAAFAVRNPDAYERLILDVVRGNQTLFMRRDEVEAAWAWVDPDHRGLGRLRRGAEILHGRHLGPVGRHRADRARRPQLVRAGRLSGTGTAARPRRRAGPLGSPVRGPDLAIDRARGSVLNSGRPGL